MNIIDALQELFRGETHVDHQPNDDETLEIPGLKVTREFDAAESGLEGVPGSTTGTPPEEPEEGDIWATEKYESHQMMWEQGANARDITYRDGVVYTVDEWEMAIDAETSDIIWSDSLPYNSEGLAVDVDSNFVYQGRTDGTVRASSPSDGSQAWSHSHHLTDNSDYVYCVESNGDLVFSGGDDNSVCAADPSDGSLVWQHHHHNYNVRGISATRDTVYSASSNSESEIVVAADAETGEMMWSATPFSNQDVFAVHYHDGVVYTGAEYGGSDTSRTVAALDADTGEVLWAAEPHGATVWGIYATDDHVYSGAEDNRVVALDPETGEEVWSHTFHSGSVRDVEVDGRTVYSSDINNIIRTEVQYRDSLNLNTGSGWVDVMNLSKNPHDNTAHSTDYSPQSHSHTGETIDPSRVENAQYVEPVDDATGASGTQTLDLSAANWFERACTGDVTIEFSNVSADPNGNTVTVYLEDGDDSGPHAITWPSGTVWAGGSPVAEIPSGGNIEAALTTPDGGSTWRATIRGQDFA